MKIISLLLSFALVLCAAGVAPAQGVSQAKSGSWEAVRSLPHDEQLYVELRDGSNFKARMRGATETKLTLARDGRTTEFDRSDVLRVYRRKSKSVGKRALVGMGVGAGIGVGIGFGVAAGDAHESGEAYLPPAVIGLVGAGLGAVGGLLTSFGRKRVLVYEARLGA